MVKLSWNNISAGIFLEIISGIWRLAKHHQLQNCWDRAKVPGETRSQSHKPEQWMNSFLAPYYGSWLPAKLVAIHADTISIKITVKSYHSPQILDKSSCSYSGPTWFWHQELSMLSRFVQANHIWPVGSMETSLLCLHDTGISEYFHLLASHIYFLSWIPSRLWKQLGKEINEGEEMGSTGEARGLVTEDLPLIGDGHFAYW